MKKLIVAAALAALPLSFALQTPAYAQASSYTPGSFWDVTGIKFKEGGGEKYLDWLATNWKRQQEFAKSKGWIEDYMVVANAYPRNGEPDLWLMIKYKAVPDAAEQVRRNAAFEQFLKMDPHQADVASGERGAIRTVQEMMMLQELKLK